MVNLTGKELTHFPMEINMLVDLKMIVCTDMELIHLPMETNTQENIKTVIIMDKELIQVQWGINTLENGKMINDTDKELTYFPTEINTGEFKDGFLNLYKLSPLYKVSQIDTWFNKKNKKKFYMIQDFSSGTITIDPKDYKNFNLKKPPKIFHSIIDVNLEDNDGVIFESKDFKDKDLEKINQIFERGYEEALEKIGFKIDPDLVKYEFVGGFNAKKI
jgi:hypothetical protein